MDQFDYIAPNSGNFIKNIDKHSDAYFDMHREPSHDNGFRAKMMGEFSPMHKISPPICIKKEVMTPAPPNEEVDTVSPPNIFDVPMKLEKVTPEPMNKLERNHRKRSMSVHAIMETLKSHHDPVNELCGAMDQTNLSTSYARSMESHYKWKNFQDSKNMKSYSTTSSQNNLHMTKFVSIAEAIYHLQKDTPKRFHSQSRRPEMRAMDAATNRKKVQLLRSTQPQSPALIAKTRNRPVTALSQKDIEEMEIMEIKKHQIKANPISKAVLQGIQNLAPVQRRPVTHPQPFNLTAVHKKIPQQEKIVPFTARPCPKHILEKPTEMVKKHIPVTIPITPKLTSYKSKSLDNVAKGMSSEKLNHVPKRTRCPLKVADQFEGLIPDQFAGGHFGVPLAHKGNLHPCKPQPFSFEQKDKERQQKKLEKIQQFYEEEKKLREFHANPLPLTILKKTKVSSTQQKSEKKAESKKENKENISEKSTRTFKARPPLVLFREPFVPEHKERPLREPLQVQLTTEIRARERDAYNQKLKEKEEQIEELKKLALEERQQKEEEEKSALRAQLVHKANPVRHYAPLVIQPSKTPLTRPEAPKFS